MISPPTIKKGNHSRHFSSLDLSYFLTWSTSKYYETSGCESLTLSNNSFGRNPDISKYSGDLFLKETLLLSKKQMERRDPNYVPE